MPGPVIALSESLTRPCVVGSARHSYATSVDVNGRICSDDVRVRRDVLELRLTESIQRDLLRDEVVDEFRSRRGHALRQRDPTDGKHQELEREVHKIVEVIGKGLLSPALSTRLQAAERELEALPAAGNVVDVKQFLKLVGPAVEAYRKRIRSLPETIRNSPDVARKVLRDGLGPIVVEPRKATDGSSYLVAKMGLELQPLLAAGGLPIDVVAGAGFQISESARFHSASNSVRFTHRPKPTVRREHPVTARPLHPRWQQQRRQARHQIQRFQHGVGGAVAVRGLERVAHPTRNVGCDARSRGGGRNLRVLGQPRRICAVPCRWSMQNRFPAISRVVADPVLHE